jgi:outer membrane protein TolC
MRLSTTFRFTCCRRAATLAVIAVLGIGNRPASAQPPAASAQPPATTTAPVDQGFVDEKAREASLPGATAVAPRLTVPTISLADAVTQTVNNQPQIKLGIQSVALRTGSVQRERGAFDWRLILVPNYEYGNTALDPSVRGDEKNRRLKFQVVAAAFGSINRQLLDQINTLGPRPPRCPLSFPGIGRDTLDPSAFRITSIRGFEDTLFTAGPTLRKTINVFRNNAACSEIVDPTPFAPTIYSALSDSNTNIFQRMFGLATGRNSLREMLNAAGFNESVITLEQTPHEVLAVTQQLAQAASAEAILSLLRLGVVPFDTVVKSGRLDASVTRRLRSGMTVGAAMHFDSSLDNFKDKSLDPNFGGSGKPMFFRANATGNISVPLMRGRGIGTTANLRAAQLSLSAETDRLRHTMSEETFRVATAYLNLIGAQESVKSFEESMTRQNQIAQLTQRRIAAGDLPAIETARTQARSNSVAASLSQARSTLVGARVALAEAMGVDAETIANAPLAAETFAMTMKALPALDALFATAAQSRLDLRALGSLSAAAKILEEGALVNAKPRLDLFARAGMGTFFDNLQFFFNPDEANPIFTLLPQEGPATVTQGAVRFSSPVGFYRAMFQRKWRPLWNVSLTLDLPFANNRRRGVLVEAEAARMRAEVQDRDLARVIRENIVSEVNTLRQRAEAIQYGQTAVSASQQTVDGAIARFQTGDQTLIDTLLSEEDLTQDRLALIQLWQSYVSELVRLRFETGTLVTFSGISIAPDQMRFDPSEFVVR